MKKHLITGLALLLPVVLTLAILIFITNFLTSPFYPYIERFLQNFNFFNQPHFFLNPEEFRLILSKFISLLGLLLFIVAIGFLGNFFFVRYLIKIGQNILNKLPLVNKIYKASHDVVNGLFSSDSSSFKEVVLVPFPSKKSLSIGFITSHSVKLEQSDHPEALIPVLIPGTPNPSVGYMLFFQAKDLIPVDMTIQETMKFVISCGVVLDSMKIKTEKMENPKI